MKKWIAVALVLLILLAAVGMRILKTASQRALERAVNNALDITQAETITETAQPTLPPATEPEPTTQPTEPPDVYDFTPEEEQLLLKLGMSERGETGCVECIALVMRTALNRMEGPKFQSTLRGVIYAQDQFTPVLEGTFESAVPNEDCYEALKMIRQGWDESQGALYYEWCEGPSWHSKNLNLLLQHCDVRFYN